MEVRVQGKFKLMGQSDHHSQTPPPSGPCMAHLVDVGLARGMAWSLTEAVPRGENCTLTWSLKNIIPEIHAYILLKKN